MNKSELNKSMMRWLNLAPDDDVSITECFEIINTCEPFRVSMFYVHFAPLMAIILDGLNNE